MTADIGRVVINQSSYSNWADHDIYQFDQCRLMMTAQPTIAFGPKLVDIVFTTSDGETISLEGDTFPELSVLIE